MPLHKGDLIGAYEIVAPLGQGGMATVYKAFHARLNRFVAIKMIHPAYLQDTNFLARFQREAQIVAALEHPHIVPVYDFSEHDGEPFLVMKLIEGSTLKARLSGHGLTPAEALPLLTPIAGALDYAHRQGVLHRDIKPSNILLDAQGTPFLSDFGLARLSLSGASTLSQDQLLGTPYYMSPEQASGRREIDHRADLYSFGVILFELFVGTVPFSDGTPYSILNDHVQRELPLPRSLKPDLSPAVEAMLLQALAKDPNDRYQSATELIDAAREALTPSPLAVDSSVSSLLLSQSGQLTPTRPAQRTAVIPEKPTSAAKPRISCSVEIVLGVIIVGLVAVLIAGLALRNRPAPVVPTSVAQVPTVTVPPRSNTLPPTLRAQPTQAHLPIGSPPPDSPGQPPPVPLIEVPAMPALQARAAILRNPNDPVPYLALARDQLQNGEDVAARRTLSDGLSHAPDRTVFEMTAADIAVQIGRYDAAFQLYSGALKDAQGTRPYPAVRDTAGQFLYNAATLTDRLTLAQVRLLNDELQNDAFPIVSAMIGRAFLTSGMPRLAAVGIDKALSQDNTLAEAHLVNGELKQAQGDSAGARAEWELVFASQSAPLWVRQRATQLLDSLS